METTAKPPKVSNQDDREAFYFQSVFNAGIQEVLNFPEEQLKTIEHLAKVKAGRLSGP